MFIKLRNKRSGFILYEAILSLMITVLTLGILQQALQILKVVQQTTFRDQLRWHVTQEKLQSLLGQAQLVDINDRHIIFLKKGEKDKRVLESYSLSALRITTATDGGHEPIMVNLKKIRIEKIQNLVIITTENKDSQTSEMYLTNDS